MTDTQAVGGVIDELNWIDPDLLLGDEFAAAGEGHVPPKAVADEAQRGLDMREQHGRGGIGPGQARARQLTSGKPMKLETIKRMKAYFDRHEVDKQGADWDNAENPSNGKIAWLLWGGDAGWKWAKEVLEKEQATVEEVDFARNIEEQLASLRMLGTETAAPVMSPLDPGFDDSERINVPDEQVTTSFIKAETAPTFDKVSKDRLTLIVRQQWLALQQAEDALVPVYERYRTIFLDQIVSKPTAIQATRSISPGMIRALPIAFSQMNALMDALRDRVNRYGVTAPSNWSVPVEQINDTEDGDDEG